MTPYLLRTLRERLEHSLGISGDREGALDFTGPQLHLRRSEAVELVELLRGQEAGLRTASEPRVG